MTAGVAEPDTAQLCAVMLSAGLAAWLLSGRDRTLRRTRLLFASGGSVTPSGSGWSYLGQPYLWGEVAGRVRLWWQGWLGGRLGQELLCLSAGGVLALLGESVLPLLAAAAAVPLVRWRQRHREGERARRCGAAQVIELCGAIAGELRAGRQPGEALRAAVPGRLDGAEAAVLAAARFGGDVPGALRQAARMPGGGGLVGMAACWQVAADSGAGLAAGLDRVAAALRAERAEGDELRAQLAGIRSTAVLLALLPAFGLLMGSVLGADPLRVLLHTPAGLGCLVVGGLLEYAGVAWMARIVRAAAPPAGREGV